MSTNAKRYLELISQHLQEHHAALFVGSGFSLNADKVTSDVPDIPLWAGLAQKFKEKLGDSDQNDLHIFPGVGIAGLRYAKQAENLV